MSIEVFDKAFKENLKLYKNNPINDQHVFKLIRKYVKKELDDVTDVDDEITIIDGKNGGSTK